MKASSEMTKLRKYEYKCGVDKQSFNSSLPQSYKMHQLNKFVAFSLAPLLCHCQQVLVLFCFVLFSQIKELPENSSIPKKTKDGLDLFYVRYKFNGSSFQAIFPSEVEEDSEDEESEEEEEENFTSLKKKPNGVQNGHRQNGVTNGHAETLKSKKSGKEVHH